MSYIQIHRDLDTPIATTRGISRIVPVHQFSEDLTWVKGPHNLKFGGVSEVNAQYHCDLKGNPLAIGAPQTRKFAADEYEFYAQDTWNLVRGLTVTAGLRWSLAPPVYEQQGYQTTILPSLGDWFAKRGALAAAGKPQAGDLSFIRKSDQGGQGIIRSFDPQQLGFSATLQKPSGMLTLAETPRYTAFSNFPQSPIVPPSASPMPLTTT